MHVYVYVYIYMYIHIAIFKVIFIFCDIEPELFFEQLKMQEVTLLLNDLLSFYESNFTYLPVHA